MSTRTVRRLRRILEMVPFLAANPGVGVDAVCERFGVDREALVADLELLWVCGLPPYGPGDLFDVAIVEDTVWLTGADSLARPLGLDRTTAARLLLAARLGAEVPDLGAGAALVSAAAKLEAVLGGEGALDVSADTATAGLRADLSGAIGQRRVVELVYWSLSRGREARRAVEPLRLVRHEGTWYLSAWCRSADGVRTFRLDRIRAATVSEERFERDVEPGEFGYRPDPTDLRVVLEIAPEAAWVIERYPVEDVGPARARAKADAGWQRVTLAAPSAAFFERLLVRLGPAAAVVKPRSMEEARRSSAAAVRALYDG
ncbi:MAG: WYL domain-containing protein [Acidimicrobiia bacterium]